MTCLLIISNDLVEFIDYFLSKRQLLFTYNLILDIIYPINYTNVGAKHHAFPGTSHCKLIQSKIRP